MMRDNSRGSEPQLAGLVGWESDDLDTVGVWDAAVGPFRQDVPARRSLGPSEDGARTRPFRCQAWSVSDAARSYRPSRSSSSRTISIATDAFGNPTYTASNVTSASSSSRDDPCSSAQPT